MAVFTLLIPFCPSLVGLFWERCVRVCVHLVPTHHLGIAHSPRQHVSAMSQSVLPHNPGYL